MGSFFASLDARDPLLPPYRDLAVRISRVHEVDELGVEVAVDRQLVEDEMLDSSYPIPADRRRRLR
jgi:hypothetical protein